MTRDYHNDKGYNDFVYGHKTSIDEQNRVLALILDDIADSLREIAGRRITDEPFCKYYDAFTIEEMLEETGWCMSCELNCPNKGKERKND